MNRRPGNRGGKKKSTTRLPQRLVDELTEKAKPAPVVVAAPRGQGKKRKLPVEEEEPEIPGRPPPAAPAIFWIRIVHASR